MHLALSLIALGLTTFAVAFYNINRSFLPFPVHCALCVTFGVCFVWGFPLLVLCLPG